MKPILFPKTATQFNTNGLGRLDFISCQVTEERNGIYELEGTIAESAEHAKQIESESIIVAKPSQGAGLQAFRVYRITKPIGGQFMVYARHISYQLGYITAMPFTVAASASACNSALQGFITNAAGYTALDFPFSFWTDVTTVSSYNQTEPATIRGRLGGVEGSILDQFGGEYEWDNFQIKLHQRRGLTNPSVTLRYGKNITDLQQEENIENTVTGIVPFWEDSEGGDLVTLPEKIVEVQNAASYPFKKTIPHDFSQAFETKPTESQLRSKAQAYISTSGIGVPKVSIKLSFVNLADTEEFKEIAPLQSVNLCDDIKVQFEKLGIDTTAEIVKTEYDVLREKYNSIEIGSLRGTLASTISTNMEDISEVNKVTKEIIKSNNNDIGQKIDDATKWLTSGDGYVVAVQDPQTHEWSELLFMDTADVETAHNVLRVNQKGIGFSRNGVNGPYTQAWTLDGRLIVGGTNVPSFTVYDSQQHVIFETTAAGTVWNSTNSSMSQNGTLTIKNATISGGTLSVLKPNAANPPTDADYIFKVNDSGIIWNLPKSQMTSDGALKVKDLEIDQGYLRIVNPNYQDWEIYPDGHVDDPAYPPYTVHYLVEMGYDGTSQTIDGLSWTAIHSMLSKQGELSFMGTLNGHNVGIKLSNNNIAFTFDGQEVGAFNGGPGGCDYTGSTFSLDLDITATIDAQYLDLIDTIPRVTNQYIEGTSNTVTFYDIDGTPYKLTTINGIVTYLNMDISGS